MTVPYGQMTERDGERISTLKARRQEKENKYEQLMAAVRRQFQVQAELFVIVVSSLGAVPEETLRDLRRLVLAQAITTAKRLVAAALKGSRDVYLGRAGGRTRGGTLRRQEQEGAERREQEEGRDQHPDQEETSQTEGEDPWLPEGENDDSIEEVPEERETEDDEDTWTQTSMSDESLEETSKSEERDPPEDPATPWWDRGEVKTLIFSVPKVSHRNPNA